jgi:nitroreductase
LEIALIFKTLCFIKKFSNKYSMLDLFTTRKTQRAFKATAIPSDHVNAIVSAGCSAPTKQRIYPYRILALTQTAESIAIKNRLFYECFINVLAKKHLLTAKAPLLLVWVGIYLPDNGDLHFPSNRVDMRDIAKSWDFHRLSTHTLSVIKNRAETDVAISSSFSMVQAESLGYRTAFNDCYIREKAVEILNLAENEWPAMFLAVGEPETVLRRQPVIKDGVAIGYSDPRPFAEPPKLTSANLVQII